MSGKLAARVLRLVLAMVAWVGVLLQAQQHVRLVMQVGSSLVQSVAFSPDARFVLTGGEDTRLLLWDRETVQQVRSFVGNTKAINSVAFSPDGKTIASGGEDGAIRIWSVSSGEQLVLMDAHSGSVNAVAFSPDGRIILSGGADHLVRLWNSANGREIRTLSGHQDEVLCVAFSPDGRYVVTGGGSDQSLSDLALSVGDTTIRIWDADTGKLVRRLEGYKAPVHSVQFSNDGLSILSAGGSIHFAETDPVRLWNVNTGKQSKSFKPPIDSQVTAATFFPDGKSFLIAWGASNDSKSKGAFNAELVDLATGEPIRSFSGEGWGSPLALSSDGRFMLSASLREQLWDLRSSGAPRELRGYGDLYAPTVYTSPDGRYFVTVNLNFTSLPQLWDTASGKPTTFNFANPEWRYSVTHTADGREKILGSYVAGEVVGAGRAYSGSKPPWFEFGGQWVAGPKNRDAFDATEYSPDGRYLLTCGSSNSATLWNIATGARIRSFDGHTARVVSLSFSSDGRFVFTGSLDWTARMWDLESGRQIRSFEGHSGAVRTVTAVPGSRFLLTAGDDSTVRLWNFETGKQLATLLSFGNEEWVVTDPEGRYDASDPDGTPALIWVTDQLRPIGLRQLKDRYYTPNLLASIMKRERLPEVKGLDLVPAPPEVVMASAYEPGAGPLKLAVTDQGGGVGRLVVSMNDRKVAEVEHPVAPNASGKQAVLVDLSGATLKPGENTVKVYAFDAGNQIRSHEAVAAFTVAARPKGFTAEYADSIDADYKPQFYGIAVGTSSFSGNHALDLQYPAHDAESMMTGLEIGAGKLFGKENVHLRLLTTDAKEDSGQPTKANIVAAFADVAKKAKPTDVFLVYLSGHGVNLRTEKDSYYYLTTDARNLEIENNPELRNLSTVSSAELRNWLGAKNMPLKEVLILDTCAAGAANEELLKLVEKRDVPPDQRRAVEFLKDATGTIILMGSAADNVSYEASKYGQGLLTYALLEGMKGRSIEEGSRLNVSHWFQNASEDVTQLAQSIGGVQKPVIAAPSGTGFPVALLDPTDQARIPLAAIKPELLHLSCHDDHDHDPLGLAVAVREHLREISHPSLRGQGIEPPVIYHDDMNDGPVDSLTPKIIYSVSGSTVALTLRIDRADNTIEEDHLSFSVTDKTALATDVAKKLVEMAAEVPVEGAKR